MFYKILLFVLALLVVPVSVYARVTPNDTYQAKREQFQVVLDKSDPAKKEQLQRADKQLAVINQVVSLRFEGDVNHLAAIMDELKRRLDLDGQPTVVAYGAAKNQLEAADYWVTYAAEAVAYQKARDYTPLISVSDSEAGLRGDLSGLRDKILHAKSEVGKALTYEK